MIDSGMNTWKLIDLLQGLMATTVFQPSKSSQQAEGSQAKGAQLTDITIIDMVLDSREVKKDSLFIALKGVNKHGLAFADKAIANGAAAILWETDETWVQDKNDDYSVPTISVDNLRDHLGQIADRFFGSPSASLTIVGVTGTDGKSTVSHFIADALNSCGQKSAVIGTLGVGIPGDLIDTGLTTPDVIAVHRVLASFKQQGIKNVVMEVSSHALDQQRVAGVRFDVALLTNLGRDHLDYHHTLDAYAEAKAKLFDKEGLRSVVLNADDEFGQRLMLAQAHKHANESDANSQQVRLVGYGLGRELAKTVDAFESVSATRQRYVNTGIQADFHYKKDTQAVHAPVLGEFNVYNLLAATACLVGLGMPFAKAIDAVKQVKGVPGRMERVWLESHEKNAKALVVVDYAHTPGALQAALKAIRNHTPNKVVCVLGCGGDRDQGKRPLMAKVAERLANKVILTDDNPRSELPSKIINDMVSGLQNPALVTLEHNRAKAIRFAVNAVAAGDSVLIAGKGHETVQIVGEQRIPFDDRKIAMAALQERAA